ncbi:MAG: ABC transporter substrate-binding protein [Candidatus Mcinerneyibacterium aminivorans]|uniref:ABC transporter substrate-binding protein n=1 Tax=Candidatus Mcinerneyibacterium aminivorans TaxID=2703815 RepID=A0A5D0MHW0_9BACT|nr:MAG: ABC transporter substrate-binding protein [Candidatus Mcinerneyibacterium aminivorans]
MKKWVIAILAISLLFISIFSGCNVKSLEKKGPIIVASKIDTEGALLGHMIIIMLRKNKYVVIDKLEFGPTNVVREAIKNGEIDIYPEYTGNGNYFFDDTEKEIWKDAQKAYEKVKNLDLKKNNIAWLNPAKANNTWGIAIRKNLADKNDIANLSDLAEYINSGNKFKIACSEEFVNRPDALPAFEDTYGFSLKKDQKLVLSGGNTAQTEKAAYEETNGVNAAMAYGTDGQLSAFDLVLLKDNKNVQPVYQPAPIVRNEIIKEYPQIRKILNPVFASLTQEKLQKLNSKIAVEGRSPVVVARNYLKENNFINNNNNE